MSLKKELKQFRKPFVGLRRYEHHTHIIIFTEKEEGSAEFQLCFADEVEEMFEYLHHRVVAVRAIELGRTVATYYDQDLEVL